MGSVQGVPSGERHFSEAEDRLAQQAACQAPPCGVIQDPHPCTEVATVQTEDQ